MHPCRFLFAPALASFVFGLCFSSICQAQSDPWTIKKVESRVLEMIKKNDFSKFKKLQKDFQRFSDNAKAESRFSIQDNRVVWRIQGHSSSKDMTTPMEYLVGLEMKAYETLLVVKESSLPRVEKIASAVKSMTSRGHSVQIQYAWSDGKTVSIYDLERMIEQKSRKKFGDFMNRLEFNQAGWTSFNIQHRAELIPNEKTPATLLVTLDIPK